MIINLLTDPASEGDTMRHLSSILILCLVSVMEASAADLPTGRSPPVYLQPAQFTWNGFYVGGNAGVGGDRYRYPFSLGAGGPALITGNASVTSSGAIGGGQIGYNRAFENRLVAGAEVDFDGADVVGRASGAAAASPAIGGGSLNVSAGSRLAYLGTVRGRLGYAFDRVLVFGTGGFAYSGVTSSLNGSISGVGSFGASGGATHTGYAVGGGIEYAITESWSVKTEYIRAAFDTRQLGTTSLFGGAALTLAETSSFNIVRAGVNYRFDLWR